MTQKVLLLVIPSKLKNVSRLISIAYSGCERLIVRKMGGSNVSVFPTHHFEVFKISVRILSSGVVPKEKERSSLGQREAAQCLSALISLLTLVNSQHCCHLHSWAVGVFVTLYP